MEDVPEEFKANWTDEIRLSEQEDSRFKDLSQCEVEDWNQKTIDIIPKQSVHRQWIDKGRFSRRENSSSISTSPGLLAAFAYKDHIAVTLTATNLFNRSLYCRYYDCRQKEMVRQRASFVFPESTVYCPRRAGAKFISLTESIEDTAEYPVPIVKRLTPTHFFTVCLSVSLNDSNALQLAQFIEHHKLQGASFFHIYVRGSRAYNRAILDDYERTGDVKVILLRNEENFERDEVWTNDCHHRNKYFAKWTAFLHLEDRLEMRNEKSTVVAYLDEVPGPKASVLRWKNSNSTSRLVVRPERVIAMNHEPIDVYVGERMTKVDDSVGVLRSTYPSILSLSMTNNEEHLTDPVAGNVLSRTNWVYTTVDVSCAKKQDANRKMGRSATCTSKILM
ncbi:unnamed protein product [Caenorhabditis sp. 36 PRJEB53466]|nr:unnamed protein product [Caenorhabditis sp. 36 PRJEB53466]